MQRIRFTWLTCCLLLSFHSQHTRAAIDQELLTEAESGDSKSQIRLALAYKKESKPQLSHFWLVQAATGGDKEALFWLGEFFESNEKAQFRSLPLAENWYLLGSHFGDENAQLAYERVLETQFNNRRANLVSSITVLDDQIDDDIQQSSKPTAPFFSQNQNRVNREFLLTTFMLLSAVIYITIKRLLLRKKIDKRRDLNHQLTEQTKKTRTLQRHLAAAHFQLKKNQEQLQHSHEEQSMHIACAVLGFSPKRLPNEKEIKLRYKKLSRIYHPDTNGSDEEMKRLNGAVKVISHYLKQK